MMKKIHFGLLGLFLAFAASVWAETIDINSATVDQLATLKGVGKAKAEAIVKDREKNGPFKSPDDLARVKGIKAGTIKKNLDMISVGGAATPVAAKPPAEAGGAPAGGAAGAAVPIPAKPAPK